MSQPTNRPTGTSVLKAFRGPIQSYRTELALGVACAGILILFSVASPAFLSSANLVNLAATLAVPGLAALAEGIVIIHGGIDLSVGAVAALSGVITGVLVDNDMLPIWPATGVALVAGTAVGLVNGLIVTRLRINAFITTLASFSYVRGLAFILTGGQTNQLTDEGFRFVGRGLVGGIPVTLVIMLGFYAFAAFMLLHTPFGRALYWVGGSPTAAALAGVPVGRVRVAAYTLGAFLASIAGILLAAQLGASFPKAASGLELTAIAAAVLGGAALAGGRGSVLGTLLGVTILRIVDNGLILANVSSYFQDVARGILLLGALSVDVIRQRSIQWLRRSMGDRTTLGAQIR